MSTSITVKLEIGKAMVHGSAQDSQLIVQLWRSIDGYFINAPFSAQAGSEAPVKPYHISLDVSGLLAPMEHALLTYGSFDSCHEAYISDENVPLQGSLAVKIDSSDAELADQESYALAAVFLQQLVLATNLVVPGSFQMLSANFKGSGAHLVEACMADSLIFSGVRNSFKEGWHKLPELTFSQVWNWLEKMEISHTHTAIQDINKVLLTLLKVAEQRRSYSARTVLLVLYQLEMLLGCHPKNDLMLLRNRLRMVLGTLPEAADCINDLFRVRGEMYSGTQPVQRPFLLGHTAHDERRVQLGLCNMDVINGSAIVLVLLQELISLDKHAFIFTESFSLQ